MTVCAILNQTLSRRVVVRLATVESVIQDIDQIQAQGIYIFCSKCVHTIIVMTIVLFQQ